MSSTDSRAARRGQWPRRRRGSERVHLRLALLLSFVAHALLLSLIVGGQGPGLPGLAFP
ncbi:MAG: hypothetical protein HY021_12495 [Burkholderiales bacterium]|nr:hypothetical protein [Burkholderiales bacterium]